METKNLRKESGNATPFFPSPIHPTSLYPVICSLKSHQGLWEMGIFGDAALPLPLGCPCPGPLFWGPSPSQPPEPSLPLANRFALCQVALSDTAASFELRTLLGPLAAVSQHCTSSHGGEAGSSAPPTQEGNSWRWGGQKHHIQLHQGW